LDDDVAQVHADAESQAAVVGNIRVARRHLTLDFRRAFHGVDDAAELGQDAVPHELDDAAAVPGDGGDDQLGTVGLQVRERARFINAHQPTVAGDVRSE